MPRRFLASYLALRFRWFLPCPVWDAPLEPAEPDGPSLEETGSTGWLTNDDGTETKVMYARGEAGCYYAIVHSPRHDHIPYPAWHGPSADAGRAAEAAWTALLREEIGTPLLPAHPAP